jgi:hypothetical protein
MLFLAEADDGYLADAAGIVNGALRPALADRNRRRRVLSGRVT